MSLRDIRELYDRELYRTKADRIYLILSIAQIVCHIITISFLISIINNPK